MEDRFSLGVFTCIFNRDFTKVLMLYRNAEKRRRWHGDWGNVGGAVELGETSLQGALREIWEEIGIRLKPKELKLIAIREKPNFIPHLHGVQFIYAASISEAARIHLNAHANGKESEGYKWFRISKLPKGMLDSRDDILRWRKLAMSKRAISQR